ncbi:unnamed protein product [Alopecurus aequalis]
MAPMAPPPLFPSQDRGPTDPPRRNPPLAGCAAGSSTQSPSQSSCVDALRLPATPSPELPEDVLTTIFAALEIPDLVRAGAVSTSWRSAYTSIRNHGNHNQSQTPCLLYTSESAGDSVACLYSLVEKRVYRLTLPEPPIRRRFLIGSSLGFLVTIDEQSEMHLVNPVTGEQIALPSVTTIQQVKPIWDTLGTLHKYEYSMHTANKVLASPQIMDLSDLRKDLQEKAFVFHDTSMGSYIVVLIHGPCRQLSFARLGDDKWTWLPPHTSYMDCTYKDRLLYAATLRGEVHAFDLSGPAVKMNIIVRTVGNSNRHTVYIAHAPSGGLLFVSRSLDIGDPDDEYSPCPRYTVEIKLHVVDAGTMRLVETDCLPDHALFLGHNHSLCLSAKEYPALKGNHAYLTDDEPFITARPSCRRDIGVVDMGSNSKEDLVSPQLWSNWPAPVWITPNLTMMKSALNK